MSCPLSQIGGICRQRETLTDLIKLSENRPRIIIPRLPIRGRSHSQYLSGSIARTSGVLRGGLP